MHPPDQIKYTPIICRKAADSYVRKQFRIRAILTAINKKLKFIFQCIKKRSNNKK